MTEPETSRPSSEAGTLAEEMVAFVRARGEEPQGVNGQPTLGQVLRLQELPGEFVDLVFHQPSRGAGW